MSDSFKRERLRATRRTALAVSLTAAVLALSQLLPPPPGLDDLASRLAYALRADLFVIAWVAIGVLRVALIRFNSAADLPGSGLSQPSEQIAVPRAILQNTLEQAMLAVFVHLALASLLRADEMRVIPAAVLLFCVGRAAFWLGYRHGAAARAFGFATTFWPSVACLALALVLLVSRG